MLLHCRTQSKHRMHAHPFQPKHFCKFYEINQCSLKYEHSGKKNIVLVGSSMAKGVPTPDAISNHNLSLLGQSISLINS